VEVAQERNCTPFDLMLDMSLDENLETRFTSVLANNDPEAIAWLLPQETVLLGLADSGAHVSQLCDACFATDLLGNWVRDKGVMPLEHAIHKLTGEPAGVFGLKDRGTIEVGKAADITKVKAEVAVEAVLEAMKDSLMKGERIELRGFGVFQVKPRKRGIGRNPRTGKEVRIPPGRTIRFKPGKELQNIS
jgi:nucleoid DNA-binding protein